MVGRDGPTARSVTSTVSGSSLAAAMAGLCGAPLPSVETLSALRDPWLILGLGPLDDDSAKATNN